MHNQDSILGNMSEKKPEKLQNTNHIPRHNAIKPRSNATQYTWVYTHTHTSIARQQKPQQQANSPSRNDTNAKISDNYPVYETPFSQIWPEKSHTHVSRHQPNLLFGSNGCRCRRARLFLSLLWGKHRTATKKNSDRHMKKRDVLYRPGRRCWPDCSLAHIDRSMSHHSFRIKTFPFCLER